MRSEAPTDKPEEFRTSGESPPVAIPPQLIEELAQILADALHEDMKQYPALSDIPPVSEPTLCSRPRSPRARRTGRTIANVIPLHETAA
jgi:hypothetical protein